MTTDYLFRTLILASGCVRRPFCRTASAGRHTGGNPRGVIRVLADLGGVTASAKRAGSHQWYSKKCRLYLKRYRRGWRFSGSTGSPLGFEGAHQIDGWDRRRTWFCRNTRCSVDPSRNPIRSKHFSLRVSFAYPLNLFLFILFMKKRTAWPPLAVL